MADQEPIDALLEEAKNRQVKLPRGKKALQEAAEAAIAAGTGVEHLIELFGLKAAAAKRKAKSEAKAAGGSSDGPTPKKAKKAAATTPAQPAFEPLGMWELPDKSDKPFVKTLTLKLLAVCRERKLKLPSDEFQASIACAQELLAKTEDGQVNVDQVLASMESKFGSEKAATSTAKRGGGAVVQANTPLVELFREIANFYFKQEEGNKGATFQKAGTAIRNCTWEITLDDLPSAKKGHPKKLENVGKGSIESIQEFLATGTTARLEELRAQI